MDYAYKVFKNVRYFYDTINPATLSGAIDVVVVEQPDGKLLSTPFHVRFGKYGVFSHSQKYVDITINGEEIDMKMKLGGNGVAFFVEETDDVVPEYLATSPLPEGVDLRSQPDTAKILEQSAKSLERHQASKTREGRSHEKHRLVSESSDASGSRSSSPVPGMSNVETIAERAAKAAELETQRKLALPRLSSVFSQRRNRSLPDLTTLNDTLSGYHSDVDERHAPKTTKKLRHSKSQAFDKRSFSHKGQINESNEDILNSITKKDGPPRRKKSRVAFFSPVTIHVSHDTDSENESLSSNVSSPSSLMDHSDIDAIADGALSDSEVDRHRRETPQLHENDVTDWKWGQFPVTRDEQKQKEGQKKNEQEKPKVDASSGWTSWWSWRGRSPAPSSSSQPEQKEEQGIYLDDLVGKAQNDPVKIEKYLGKGTHTSQSYADSGNGSSRGATQPSSPTTIGSGASSDVEMTEKTPTQETVSIALSKMNVDPNDIETKSDDGRQRYKSDTQRSITSEPIFPLSEDEHDELGIEVDLEEGKRYYRSLRLSSDKLKSLGLARGANEVRFSITTKFQGTTWCSCNVYLYKWHEKIVISDIDGTITKSDVLGHVIPAIGGQWAHAGVAELYTRIKNNGYKMVYLSSRAIGQSHITKQYLKSVAQDSKVLPDGPVLLSPTSVLVAFRREVIERRPEEFKIAALTDLKKLFPVKQPFFCGFGNRETDTVSYRAVDIPTARILIIDPTGKVRRADSRGLVSSYLNMASETVDYLFPPLAKKSRHIESSPGEKLRSTFTQPLVHSSFTHWKQDDFSLANVDDGELNAYEAKRRQAEINRKKKK